MRIKYKILTFFGVILTMMISLSFSVYAIDIQPSDFSQYVNCFKNDIYTEATYITPLNKINLYNVGTECFDKYGEKEIKANPPKYSNFGFKINGEFYISAYQLTETGTYKIEIFFYERTKEGYYKAKGTSIETFYVFVDLGFNVEQTKTNFYYEYYNNEEEFIEDVNNSFNQDISLTLAAKNALKKGYSEYNGEKKTMNISIIFKNVLYNFTIYLVSLDEIKDNFLSLSDVIKDAKIGQAYLYENRYSSMDTINEALGVKILNNVYKNLKLADGQKVDIEIDSDVNMKTIGGKTFQIYTIPIKVTEINTNEEIMFSLSLMIYKENYLLNEKDCMRIDFENFEYFKNQTILNNHETYFEFFKNSVAYRDYSNTPHVKEYRFNHDTNQLICSLYYKNLEETKKISISFIEESTNTKILTRYNYIVLPKKDSVSFSNQIKIISSEPNTYTCNVIDINGEDWLEINVISSVTNEKIASKTVKIVYIKNNMNFFQKITFEYGKFLRKIFF